MLFQMMFAIITPALISGAVAERIKFSAYLLFTVLWVTMVYFPLCHMVWGKGGLFNWALGGKSRCWISPAAPWCTSVPASRRWSARWCSGKRVGFPHEPMLPHNVVLSLIGTGLLWVGWFGFNAGSAVNAGALATSAFAATHFSAAAGALSWAASEWLLKGKPSVLGAASGMVAGLATITPASGFVSVPAAFLIGLAGGAVCYFAVTKAEERVSAMTIRWTSSAFTASAARSACCCWACWPSPASTPPSGPPSNPGARSFPWPADRRNCSTSSAACCSPWPSPGLATFVILKVVDALVGLRVSAEEEDTGLDLTQHGESAYND